MKALVHLAGNIAPVLAGLVTAPLTARSLGPAARGELAILLIVAAFIGLIGALGLGLLARKAVAADLGQAHGWSRRGKRITLVAVLASTVLGYLVTQSMSLEARETWAATILFAIAGMSASRSVDGNILIVAGRTRQFGLANLAASGTVALGIIVAFLTGTLTLWTVVAFNAGSLVVQMAFIIVPMRQLLRTITESDFRTESLRSLMGRAWRAWRSQILEAGIVRTDTLLFIAQSSVQTVGFYAVVSLIPQMGYQVVQTLIQSSYAKSPALRLRIRTKLLWQVTVCSGVLMAAGATIAAVPLVPLLFGPAFSPSLELLWTASVMTVGLAGLAPVLHHYATSPTRDSWFPILLVLIIGTGWWIGVQTATSTGVGAVGMLLLALSALYVYLLAGKRAFQFRWKAWRDLYG